MKYAKHFLAFTAVTVLALSSFVAGCTKDEPKPETDAPKQVTEIKDQMPDQERFPMNLVYSNGEGHWGDHLIVSGDGSFKGSYNHINSYEKTNEYPKGIKSVSEYKGKFSDIKKVNDFTYSMKVESVETVGRTPGESWIEDGYKYNVKNVTGIETGTEFLLLLPSAPMSNVASDIINQWDIFWGYSDKPKTLEHYTLYNVKTTAAYFNEETYKDKNGVDNNSAPVEENKPVAAPVQKTQPPKITKLNAVGRVTGEGVTIRSAPSTTGTALGYLSKGVLVDVSERYVSDDPNAAVVDADSLTWMINGAKVTVYKGHALSIINEKDGMYRCDLTYGDKYYTVHINMNQVRRITGDMWYKIYDNKSGKTGYIFGDYLMVN